jgi:hypothetical protein
VPDDDAMSEYQFRYMTADGGLALLYLTLCDNDGEARIVALDKFGPEHVCCEIWRGFSLVEKYDRATQAEE